MHQSLRFFGVAALATALLFGSSCSSGGGGGGGGFSIDSINVADGQVWKINRPILVRFSQPVEFTSVSLNTINIREVGGAPSSGEFTMQDPFTVKFQPQCPIEDDLSDAGLQPGGVAYELNILGLAQGSALTVKSKDGDSLELGDARNFSTPLSLAPEDLYFDVAVGPPAPVVRTTVASDNNPNACYLEIAGNDAQRHYFERNLTTGAISLDPPLDVPLNLLSLQGSKVELVLYFNQPLNPSSSNISSQRLPWRFQNANNLEVPLTTSVTLESNCTEAGAIVRVVPQGILPSETTLRAVVTTQFEDIVGDKNILVLDSFALAETTVAPVPFVDEFFDPFANDVFEDEDAPVAETQALWGNGKLEATFGFTGTGGPSGTFDYVIDTGEIVIFDTVNQTIIGGPNFGSTTSLTVQGGVLDLNDFWIKSGGLLKVQGPNALTIQTTGTVRIDGTIECNGIDSAGVFTLGTANVPEPGASGVAGGGRGGTGSPLTTASDPKGGNGLGAFNTPEGGGIGGETGWSAVNGHDNRRGAGGGGGIFGGNQDKPSSQGGTGLWDQRNVGLDAEPGFPNNDPDAFGATSGIDGPFGGQPGVTPFSDDDTTNNFFGTMLDQATGKLIKGELAKPWAGAGGGAGGDASFITSPSGTFPNPVFDPANDQKGAGGGGGGGRVLINSLGNIVFGPDGTIFARGGTGGGGENFSSGTNRVGGGSGGGAGGHVILQTAGKIDLSQFTIDVIPTGANPQTQVVFTNGAQGGAGKADAGGSFAGSLGKTETKPDKDSCPPGYPTTVCLGHIDGAGGDGGPGIIQMHTQRGLDPVDPDIILPVGQTIGNLTKPTVFGYPNSGTSNSKRLVPSFGSLSRARSEWIPIGEGGFDPSNPIYKNLVLNFGGINPATGNVEATGGVVNALAPVVGPQVLAVAPALPHIKPDGFSLEIAASALVGGTGGSNGYFTANPHLMKGFVLELSSVTNPSNLKRFQIAGASYRTMAQSFLFVAEPTGPALTTFQVSGGINVAVRPAFFRISTNGTVDSLPASARVQISFQGTVPNANGFPDETAASAPTSDLSTLSGTNTLRFFRFDVLFDIDALDQGLTPTTPTPALDFLRIPIRFQ